MKKGFQAFLCRLLSPIHFRSITGLRPAKMRTKSVTLRLLSFAGSLLTTSLHAAEAGDPTIGLIGDSTVAHKEGWGPAFERITKDSFKVINRAKNGGTLETTSGQMDKLLQQKPDYVLIQFGHNDMWEYDAEVYAEKLAEYIERTRRAGGKAVVLSSVTCRNFDDAGKILPVISGGRSLPQFARSAEAVAKKMKVHFIDLNAISIEHHNRIGPDESASYNAKEGDTTHLSPKGADAIARIVIAELKKAVPELAHHLD
jgi:pectinesterase